jgi:hypothetical protein
MQQQLGVVLVFPFLSKWLDHGSLGMMVRLKERPGVSTTQE